MIDKILAWICAALCVIMSGIVYYQSKTIEYHEKTIQIQASLLRIERTRTAIANDLCELKFELMGC